MTRVRLYLTHPVYIRYLTGGALTISKLWSASLLSDPKHHARRYSCFGTLLDPKKATVSDWTRGYAAANHLEVVPPKVRCGQVPFMMELSRTL